MERMADTIRENDKLSPLPASSNSSFGNTTSRISCIPRRPVHAYPGVHHSETRRQPQSPISQSSLSITSLANESEIEPKKSTANTPTKTVLVHVEDRISIADGPTTATHKPPPNWRPWPFSPYFIFALILFHLLQMTVVIIIYAAYNFPNLNIYWTFPFSFEGENSFVWFCWQYLPVLVLLLAGLGWYTLDVTARTMEPYYQMSRQDTPGAKAMESVSVDYITTLMVAVPFRAFGAGHKLVGLTSMILLLVLTVLPVVQGNLWKVQFNLLLSGYFVAGQVNEVRGWMVWIVIALHAVVIILGTTVMVVLTRRRTGVYSDPRGIGGLAALICESPIIPLLKRINTRSSQNGIDALLQFYRFRLEHIWVVNEGDKQPREVYQIVPYADETWTSEDKVYVKEWRWSRNEAHPVSLRGLATFLVNILVAGPYITLNVGIITDLDSMSVFQMKILISCICVISATFVEMQERDLRLMQSFYLSRPAGDLKNCGLAQWAPDYITLPPLSVFFTALRHSQSLLLAIFTISALITSATVMFWPPIMELAFMNYHGVSALPNYFIDFVTGEGIKAMQWCIGLYQFFTWIGLLTGARKPIMPRKPNTISSVMVYLSRSPRLLLSAKGTSMMNMIDRAEYAALKEQLWLFGWIGEQSMPEVGFGTKDEVTKVPWNFFGKRAQVKPEEVDVSEEVERVQSQIGR